MRQPPSHLALSASERKSDAATRCGGVDDYRYEMPAAVQAAAPALLHRVVLSTKLSLITVAFMLLTSTQVGTRSDAGCWLPETPDGGVVVPLRRALGGVCPARRTVARATASCASR